MDPPVQPWSSAGLCRLISIVEAYVKISRTGLLCLALLWTSTLVRAQAPRDAAAAPPGPPPPAPPRRPPPAAGAEKFDPPPPPPKGGGGGRAGGARLLRGNPG